MNVVMILMNDLHAEGHSDWETHSPSSSGGWMSKIHFIFFLACLFFK